MPDFFDLWVLFLVGFLSLIFIRCFECFVMFDDDRNIEDKGHNESEYQWLNDVFFRIISKLGMSNDAAPEGVEKWPEN